MTGKMSGWLAMALLCVFGPFVLRLAADPPPKTGAKRDTLIYVRTDPPGAKVLLDGKEVKELGRTNGLFRIDAGVATIILELEGYGQEKRHVTIQADKITRIEIELKPQNSAGEGQTTTETPSKNQKADGENPPAPFEAELLRQAEAGVFMAKYRLWAGYQKGAEGIPKNPEKAKKLLDDLVKDVYLAKFQPVKPFAPKTPSEFLANFAEHSTLRSAPNGIGGASFFRTTNKNGMLIGSFLTVYPDKMRKAIADNPSLKFISVEKLTPEMFIPYDASPQEGLRPPDAITALLGEAELGNYWSKYQLWAAYQKGTDGVEKDAEKANKWLAEVVKDAYLAKFRPIKGFAPQTPSEFIAKFNEYSHLQSEPMGLGGASFFRTKNKDGMLIGSFITAYPDKMRKAIANNPSLELISIEKMTPEMFIRYEASPQESLDTGDETPSEKTGVVQAVKDAVTTISQCAEGDPRVDKALKSLSRLNQPEVVSLVAPYLDSSTPTIRRSAIYILWRGKFADSKAAAPALEKLLGHEEEFTRGMAALALGQNKVPSSYDGLVKMTASDSSGYARRCAAIALGWLGDNRAKPTLEAALKDSDPLVAANAKAALGIFERHGVPVSEASGEAQEAAREGADAKVVEGVGWGGFRVGATREELIKAFGPLEHTPTPGSQWTGWVARYHIDCWFDQAGRAVEVRFNRGFNLPLTSGVKIGSPEKDVLAAYGSPDRVVNTPQSKMLEYGKRGVLMWIMDGKVFDFTVFRPQESRVATEAGQPQNGKERTNQQRKARERMHRDVQAFSDLQRREIELLYQVANKKWQTQEARDSLKTLVEKYKKANRTGCAVLYLGQMSQGDEQIAYLKQAIADYSDCFYGDGVQVGAFARFLLAQVYLKSGNASMAKTLFDEIRNDYPDSVDHRGNSLVAQLPTAESQRDPPKTPAAKGNILENPGLATVAIATDATVPEIVSMSPTNDAKDVDPTIKELRVTFNVPMAGGFSWTGGGPNFPKTTGAPRWTKDHKTCVLPVKLKPRWKYQLGLNSPSFKNFQSASGVPLEPVVYQFTTRGAGKAKDTAAAGDAEKEDATTPEIVSMNPPNGAKDVDPTIKELRVKFNVPMGEGFSWTGGGPNFPKTTGRPRWTKDHKTCVLPVKLEPGSDCELGLNSPSFKNFQSRSGVPLEPVAYQFTTRDAAKAETSPTP